MAPSLVETLMFVWITLNNSSITSCLRLKIVQVLTYNEWQDYAISANLYLDTMQLNSH